MCVGLTSENPCRIKQEVDMEIQFLRKQLAGYIDAVQKQNLEIEGLSTVQAPDTQRLKESKMLSDLEIRDLSDIDAVRPANGSEHSPTYSSSTSHILEVLGEDAKYIVSKEWGKKKRSVTVKKADFTSYYMLDCPQYPPVPLPISSNIPPPDKPPPSPPPGVRASGITASTSYIDFRFK